jgi:hypothetical protein
VISQLNLLQDFSLLYSQFNVVVPLDFIQREIKESMQSCGVGYLDRFHITMRLTVIGQYAKGLDTTQENRQEILKSLESVKHYLWHGNVALP